MSIWGSVNMSLSGDDCFVSNSELWQAIKNVPLPDVVTPKDWTRPSKTETFQERLSSEHDLTEESARRLVEEYRRFLYLKAIDGGSLTPSERVDQAWHLHMEIAGEGWAQFCDEVLKFRIDHRTGLSRRKQRRAMPACLSSIAASSIESRQVTFGPESREKATGYRRQDDILQG